MVKVGWNYGKKEKCPICSNGDDTQSHLLECEELNAHPPNSDPDNDTNNMERYMTRLETAIRRREIILEEREKILNT